MANTKRELSLNDKILCATYYGQYRIIKKLVSGPFDPYIVPDMPDFPVWAVSVCQAINYANPMEWTTDARPSIQRMLDGQKHLLEFWKEVCGFDVDSEIDFQKYHEYFFSDEPDETPEGILWENDIPAFIKRNQIRQIDVDLFCAVNRFDYPEVERLLKAGADPTAEMGEYDSTCMQRIGVECSFLELDANHFSNYYRNGKLHRIHDVNIRNVIGLAAHNKMYNMIKEYDPRKDEPAPFDTPIIEPKRDKFGSPSVIAGDYVFVVKSTSSSSESMDSNLTNRGFELWNNSRGFFDGVNWLFVNIETKVYARGMPGVGITKPRINHAITFNEFNRLYKMLYVDKNRGTFMDEIHRLEKKYEGLSMLDMGKKK